MSQEQNAAVLSQFMQSTAPMSQVRENLNPPNGWYDLFILELSALLDDNGLVYIQGRFKINAPADIASRPGAEHRERFYIGTKTDKLAEQPETRLNSPGFSRLKGIARVTDVPTNDQTVGQLCAALTGKGFTTRIESRPKDKNNPTGDSYCNLGRNPVKLGVVPAKLDVELGHANGQAGPVTTTAQVAAAPVGSFGTE